MKYLFVLFFLVSRGFSIAQHDHTIPDTARWEHIPVFKKSFTDSGYIGKEVSVARFIVPPGARDTIVHQHDCQLIGYIAEGAVITKMKNKEPIHLTQGQVFYEYPNEVHESLINPDKQKRAVIILYYLYHTGAVLYKKM